MKIKRILQRAVTVIEACIVLAITIIVAGVAITVLIKVCKHVPKPKDYTQGDTNELYTLPPQQLVVSRSDDLKQWAARYNLTIEITNGLWISKAYDTSGNLLHSNAVPLGTPAITNTVTDETRPKAFYKGE